MALAAVVRTAVRPVVPFSCGAFTRPVVHHALKRSSALALPVIRPFSLTPLRHNTRYRRFEDSPSEILSGGPGKPPRSRHTLRDRILWGVVASIGLYYVSNLEKVPETGRWRFMDVGPNFEQKMWETSYDELVNEFRGKIIPPDHPIVRKIHAVASRILEANNLGTLKSMEPNTRMSIESIVFGSERGDLNWDSDSMTKPPAKVNTDFSKKEWHLIVVNDPNMVNAMATPGSIVVFTGILPIVQDEDHLAAVLGHEIGHVVLRHSAERMSSMRVAFLTAIFIDYIVGGFGSFITTYLMALPNSRQQEMEADRVGLKLSSNACYDPKSAPEVFERLAALERKAGRPAADFLTTHPASERRVKALESQLHDAYAIRAANPACSHMEERMSAFRDALGHTVRVFRL